MTLDPAILVGIAFSICVVCGHFRFKHLFQYGKCTEDNCICTEFKSEQDKKDDGTTTT